MMGVILLMVCSSVLTVILARSVPCVCSEALEPVCGQDGVTYNNTCIMECAGVTAAENPLSCCSCELNYNPVCGINGRSYGNECMATCRGIRVVRKGECPRASTPSPCSDVYEPVCGVDGMTYGNLCKAGGVRIASDGECPRQCFCSPNEYRPVCGSDGRTYQNLCLADCVNEIYVVKIGKC
ncbi:serine protease inhibitor dipetalogastin-like [Saccostrea echinata]|uniref:serine protease inhibitor dipetalogastin-like n=1 Tax=Saccostrea echinata TaxID=191078 RepID=UPI002A80DD5E|nr:serine protease inhibitor dipetalogastin-like [Saccostrea echinata]